MMTVLPSLQQLESEMDYFVQELTHEFIGVLRTQTRQARCVGGCGGLKILKRSSGVRTSESESSTNELQTNFEKFILISLCSSCDLFGVQWRFLGFLQFKPTREVRQFQTNPNGIQTKWKWIQGIVLKLRWRNSMIPAFTHSLTLLITTFSRSLHIYVPVT